MNYTAGNSLDTAEISYYGRINTTVMNGYTITYGIRYYSTGTGERTLAITFRCVVKEHNFDEANAKISILKKTCEEFEIISQEEL